MGTGLNDQEDGDYVNKENSWYGLKVNTRLSFGHVEVKLLSKI